MTVLVQLLRATERLSVADALVAESLAYATLQAGPELRRWLLMREARPPPPVLADPAALLEREGHRLSIVLNRPKRRNEMSVEMRDALAEALRLVLPDREIREVRISGRGRCFSSGGDLGEFGTAPDPATAHIVRSLCVPGAWLAPGAGGCVSLPRRIGRQRTAWLTLCGARINASTALAWGLVDAIE